MGNAAAVQSVSESARRRLLLQQHNARPDLLVSRAVLLAFRQCQAKAEAIHQPSFTSTSAVLLPLRDLFDVLNREFRVCCTLEELPRALEQLGCRLVTTDDADNALDEGWYCVEPLVEFIAPRRVLRQVKRPAQPTEDERELSWNGLTIWQAAKGGRLDVVSEVCKRHPLAFRALDAFENTPLYYASLCGREEAASALMACYDHAKVEIPADELLRCVTNALNAYTRALLQRKMTLEEALMLKRKEKEAEEEEEGEGGGSFLGLGGDDDED
jgi:hypothetical protein